MDNPGDAKYGMTKEQLIEAFTRLKTMGVKNFGIHSFLCSNTVIRSMANLSLFSQREPTTSYL